MSYATRQDIETLRGASYLETLLPVDVDAGAAVARALGDAGAMIDPYLSRRYRLPVGAVPAILRQVVVDLACWHLASAAERLTEEIEKRAKMRLDFLKDVAAGRADIAELELAGAAAIGPDGSAHSDSGASFTAQPRRFDRGEAL